MAQFSLKHLFWIPLKSLMIHLVLSNNEVLNIQKKKTIIGLLKINLSRNKFTDFKELILNETELFLIDLKAN